MGEVSAQDVLRDDSWRNFVFVNGKIVERTKKCAKCKRTLPLSKFGKYNHYNTRTCDDCKEFIINNPEIVENKHAEMCKRSRQKRIASDKSYMENERKRAREYYHSTYQKKRDDWLSEYRTPCLKCGETRSWCLVWHHVDPNNKTFNIGAGTPRIEVREKIIEETKKCVNLCDNCHRDFHHIYGHKPEHPKEALEEYLGFTLNGEDSNDRTLCPSNRKHI